MSVLINMEMPKPGRYEAVIVVLDKSTAEIAISPAEDDIGYWKEYPLVHVPPQSSLITTDVAVETAWMILEGLGFRKNQNLQLAQTVRQVFDTAPAIVSAEPQKEES